MTTPTERKFQVGDYVRKKTGSSWHGRVCGFYSTKLNPICYCVENHFELGSVQIYPETALELVEHTAILTDTRAEGEAVRWLQQVLDGTSVKISGGDWRVEKDHWHGITMSVSFARTLSAQLAEERVLKKLAMAALRDADARLKQKTGG